ncbi:MAG TPA: hypothetical protein VEP90_10775, partial [Methylomirabilota bacterium]|nr:hypothetical protein [Methylomirabilota bacterium]
AKPYTFEDAKFEQSVATQLLNLYEQAQRKVSIDVCAKVEGAVKKWLMNIPVEAYQSPMLTVLIRAIEDTEHTTSQLAALTLLTEIAGQLESCPPLVFKKLAESLLGLAGLPPVGDIQPSTNFPRGPSFAAKDLSLLAIYLLGKQGPSGLFLTEVRQHFEAHPHALHNLGRLSLAYEILITPVSVPQAPEGFQRYKAAVDRWNRLRSNNAYTNQDIDICIEIHRDMLACAEEVRYPNALYLLTLLEALETVVDQTPQSLHTITQNYMLGHMRECDYINYQETTLLWQTLYPTAQSDEQLKIHERFASIILQHYLGGEETWQQHARRFLVVLSNELKDLQYTWRLEGLRERRDFRYLPDRGYLSLLWYLRELMELIKLRDFQRINQMQELKSLEDLRYHLNLRDPKLLQCMRNILLTSKVVEKTTERLSLAQTLATNPLNCVDLLTILLGRILYLLEVGNKKADAELKKITEIACSSYRAFNDEEVRSMAIEIVSFLPARTKSEINALLGLATESTDEPIQEACALALRRSKPVSETAWNTLALGKTSKIITVRKAVEDCLRQRKAEKVKR